MTNGPSLTDLRIDALEREIERLKAFVPERMHDSGAIGVITYRLRMLDAEVRQLRRARLAQRPIGRVVLGG